MAWTYHQLAKKFDVAESTIGHWKKQGCPVRGTVEQIRKWLETYEANNPRKQAAVSDPQLAAAKKARALADAKRASEDAKIAELKRMAMERSLVPIAQARALVEVLAERARSRALNVGKSWARKFVGLKDAKAAELKLEELVREIVKALQEATADA